MFNFFKNTKKDNNTSSKNEKKENIDTIHVTKERIVEPFEKLSVEELVHLTENELEEYLKKAWNIAENLSIKVWGYVNSRNNFYTLKKVKNSINHKNLEYPISNLGRETIVDRGIFLEYSDKINPYASKYISCNLVLSSKHEREKKSNPLLLQVDKKSIEIYKNLSEIELLENENEEILIEESIFNHYKSLQEKEINKDIKKNIEEKDKIQTELSLLKNSQEQEERNLLKIREREKRLLQETEREKLKKEKLSREILEIKVQIEKDKKMREENLKQIQDFIKSKAQPLRDMEFINESEYKKIMGNYQNNIKKDEKFVDFNKDFKKDYSKALFHIQAYLFNQNTVYYRYLLEDYFTSILTNDLIILAGDSGSGKTNLVKKFAEVVGGVAKIIPVKPNWTSSDDLLGYYNPLQKSYLSTPFLDALIEANENPTVPYFICLDEMNLARVEYYFADFLSLLEERDKQPTINLYSDSESTHTISEFNHVLALIEEVKKGSDKKIVTFMDILKDEKLNSELKKVFGFGDKDSLIKYHSDLRRMIGGVLNIPSSIAFPKNVRIIGTINIDETTHYLSPKILDRVHVIKLNSPSISDWDKIEKEVLKLDSKDIESKISFKIEDFGVRESYPQYSPKDSFCKIVSELSEGYLSKLGIEVSLRAIRQGLKYNQTFYQFNSNIDIVFNNFLLHKILPKFTFDGNTQVGKENKLKVLESLHKSLKTVNSDNQILVAKDEIEKIIQKSYENDGLVNYWA